MRFLSRKEKTLMRKFDYKLLIFTVLLSLFGILMIYSASSIWSEYKFNDSFRYLKLQSLFFIVGIVILYIVSKVDYTKYLKKANIILGICFLLLILVLIPGIGTIRNGSRSWFGIGGLGVQPSEFMKLGIIIFTSKYLSTNPKEVKRIIKGVFPILIVAFLAFALIMLQPDLGTGAIILVSVIGLLFVSGVNMGFFVKIGSLGLLGLAGLIVAAPYRIKRIVSFINPWSDPLGAGFQSIQSLYAIGPGGLLGFGLFNSVQKHFYLPEPQTDFIFSIISEELGIFGILIVATLFILIFYRCIKIAINCDNLFGKYLVFGITFQMAFQTILNLAVVVGLVPITGVTLPFLSYGGSSLILSLISIGIILSVSRYNEEK